MNRPAPLYDVTAVGNAIVDVLAPCDEAFLSQQGLVKGSMQLVTPEQSHALYLAMADQVKAHGVEASGGSAGNTVAGIASLEGRGAYVGKVGTDALGQVFTNDIRRAGLHFDTAPLAGAPTGRCLINVTPDGQRTMCTSLGAASQLQADDIDEALIAASSIVYLEGYLFDPTPARAAFERAARLAHQHGRRCAITLSDTFVVDRWRAPLMAFVEGGADIVLANEAELLSLFQTDDFESACTALAQRVEIAAVTRSEKGSLIVSGGKRIAVPAAPVEQVVDTTGAGDQYAAGFLLGLSRGESLERCGALGAMAASEVIAHWGPRPATSLARLAERL